MKSWEWFCYGVMCAGAVIAFTFAVAITKRNRQITLHALSRKHVNAETPVASLFAHSSTTIGAHVRVAGILDTPWAGAPTIAFASFDAANRLIDTMSDLGFEVVIEGSDRDVLSGGAS